MDSARLLREKNYLGIPLSKEVGGRGLNSVCAVRAKER